MDKRSKIHQLREEGNTIPQICKILNLSKGSVGYYLTNYNGKFKNKRGYGEFDLLLEECGGEIINLYKENISISIIASKYNVSQFFIKKYLIKKKEYKEKNRKLNIKYLIEGKIKYKNPYHGSINFSIKAYLLKEKIFKYKCYICNISKWNNKEISLDLDHIDGNRENNLLNNLRLLCPNCHSQTSTFKGRNNKKAPIM